LSDLSISVIIPTHNRADALALTLERLSKQNFSGAWEVIVVNNNSTDGTEAVVMNWVRGFPVRLKLIHEKKPGPAAARNEGAKLAEGKYLLFMDNDILTEKDFIDRHFARLIENPGCWIVGQFPNLPQQEETVFGRYKRHLFPVEINDQLVIVDGITGQGTSMPRSDFERLAGFDEQFFVASGEDRELAMRAISVGIRILYDSSIIALHNDWAGTNIRDYCRRQRIYTQTEPLFAVKYGAENPRHEMFLRNSPPNYQRDGVMLAAIKLLKGISGSSWGQNTVLRMCEILERFAPDTRILWAFYRVAIAGAIYKGYQEGLAKLAGKASFA
jgi:GT2 family glycosyltransferase